MAEKEIRIGLRTDLKGTGLKDAGAQLDKVDSSAKASTRSIDAMETTVRDLERALRALDPGTAEFEQTAVALGQARAELQRTSDVADQFAVKAGGAAAGLRNFGGIAGQVGFQVQDFAVQVGAGTSALTAFAQQGSQLLGAFGPTGAVAGAVLAITAIVAKVMQLKSETEDEKSFKGLVDSLTEISDRSRELAEDRRLIEQGSMADVFDDEKAAIDRQTRAFLANVDAMKERIQAAGSLDKIMTSAALAGVASRQATGEMSAADAEAQRRALETAARERELQRNLELSKLSEEVARAEEAKALAQKEAAERYAAITKEGLDAAERTQQALKERADRLTADFEAVKAFSNIFLGDPKAAFDFDPNKIAETRGRFDSMSDSDVAGFKQLFDLLETYRASADAVRGLEVLQTELPAMMEAFRAAREALDEATRRATDAQDARGVAEGRGRASRDALASEDAAGALRNALENRTADFERTGEEAAQEISRVFEAWVQSLGTAAQAEKPADVIAQVRELLADGLQGGESDRVLALAQEVARQINSTSAKTSQAFTLMQSAVASQGSRMDGIVRDLRALQQQIKDLSKSK